MSPFLRVIDKEEGISEGQMRPHSVPEHSGQLRFEFDIDPIRRIVLVPMDDIDGVLLHEIVLRLTPVAAMDLRHAVRFDLPGTNRNRFFGDLRLSHTIYIREPIEWHNLDSAPFALDAKIVPHRLFHEVIERDIGHVLLLVPNKQDAGFMASALNIAMTAYRTHGWRIEQAA